jgi:cell division protein FtsB
MSKNRKREATLLRMLPLTKWLLVFVAIAMVGVGYVWQKNTIHKLGDDLKQREQQVEKLRERHTILVQGIAGLKTPRAIETKCKAWNLGLGMPKESQIVRVTEPLYAPTAKVPGIGQVAARERSTRDN